MNPMNIRNQVIGQGKPKICVPIATTSLEELRKAAVEVAKSSAELVEWRADWFDTVFDLESIKVALAELRKYLGDMPILFTFRSKGEGGEKEISYEKYKDMLTAVAETRLADLIDVEVFMSEETEELIEELHKKQAIVVGSNHDFFGTPNKEEIIRRLCKMQEMGADIPKIAVMPQDKKDVMTLLEATFEMAHDHAKGPIVTMSMSQLGVSSRMWGEFFGSAITFASVGQASAPGQIGAEELREILDLLHQ